MDAQELSSTCRQLQRVLGAEALQELGYTSGWVKRRRTATAERMGVCLVAALCTQKVETIAQLQRAFNLWSGSTIQYKPFHKRLAAETFPVFMHGVVELMLSRLVSQVLKPLPGSPLSRFEQVVIQDGSSFALKDCLLGEFPGRFTTVTPSAVELHATLELYNDELSEVSLAPDTVGERKFLPSPESLAGRLLLADRGYMDVRYAAEVNAAGGHFIVRFKKQFNPDVVGGHVLRGRRLRRLGGPLQVLWTRLNGRSVDLDVVHPKGGCLRMVALWNPSKKDHLVLVTNLPREDFSAEVVRSLYRLRWQVELVFKEWKSFANLHKYDTGKAALAEGLIWASLAAAILKRFIAHAAERLHGVEISTLRAAAALRLALLEVLRALLSQRGLRAATRELLKYIASNAPRAHPKRDSRTGRKRCGLSPLHVSP